MMVHLTAHWFATHRTGPQMAGACPRAVRAFLAFYGEGAHAYSLDVLADLLKSDWTALERRTLAHPLTAHSWAAWLIPHIAQPNDHDARDAICRELAAVLLKAAKQPREASWPEFARQTILAFAERQFGPLPDCSPVLRDLPGQSFGPGDAP